MCSRLMGGVISLFVFLSLCLFVKHRRARSLTRPLCPGKGYAAPYTVDGVVCAVCCSGKAVKRVRRRTWRGLDCHDAVQTGVGVHWAVMRDLDLELHAQCWLILTHQDGCQTSSI